MMPTAEQIPAKPAENPVHLVLASGGMRCLSYAGVLSVLAENGITFARVTGVSGGTLAGALLCAGVTPQEIERLTETVSPVVLSSTPVLSRSARCGWPLGVATTCPLSPCGHAIRH